MAKERHFFRRRGGSCYGGLVRIKRLIPIIGPGQCLLAFELPKHGFELRLLDSERGKPSPNMLNLLGCHAVAINVSDSSLLQAQVLIRMRKVISTAARMSASPRELPHQIPFQARASIFHRRRPVVYRRRS
jgi:hypothetical protein